MKPEYKPINYPLHYGQLVGGIKLLSFYLDKPELLNGKAEWLVGLQAEIGAQIEAQKQENLKALQTETV